MTAKNDKQRPGRGAAVDAGNTDTHTVRPSHDLDQYRAVESERYVNGAALLRHAAAQSYGGVA